MPETTPLIKAALNLRVGAGFDVYKLVKRLDELDPIPLPWKSDEEALKDFWDYCEERQREERIIAEMKIKG